MKGSALVPVFLAAATPFLVITLIVTATGFGLIAWKPPVLWSYVFGASNGGNSATAVASDSSGVYVEGYMNNSGLYSPGGGGSLFLSNYYPDGSVSWSRTIGNTSNTYIDGMSVGPDGIYLTGADLRTGLVLKYDLSGNRAWLREFGNQSKGTVEGDGISATSAGVYVAGVSGLVKFVREYDFVGNVVWTSGFSNSSGVINGIWANSSGVYVLTDRLLVKYDLNGNQLWMRLGGGTGLASDMTGEYVSGFSVVAYSLPYGFLRKYDSDGNVAWTVQFDAPDNSGVERSLVSADSSGVYLSMNSIAVHVFVMKYDSGGGQIWGFQVPTAGLVSNSIAVGAKGFYLAGSLRPRESYGFVEEFGQSSSLIFFGFNPPLSFAIVGVLVGVVAVSVVFFGRYRKKLRKRPPAIYRPSVSVQGLVGPVLRSVDLAPGWAP